MDYIKELVEAIKPLLKKYGMKKTSLNWYREDEKIIRIFNIQKSIFGKQIYLNIGIKIKEIEPDISKSSIGSHISARLDHFIDKKYLDFENNITTSERNSVFINLINSNPYNFFTLKSDNEEILKFIIENDIHAVYKIAKDYLKS